MKKILFLMAALLFVITMANAQDASFICTCNKEISKKLLQSTDTVFRLDIGEMAKFITMDGNVVKSYLIGTKKREGSDMYFFFEDKEGNQGCVSIAMDINIVQVVDMTIQKDVFVLKLDLDKTKEFNAKKHSTLDLNQYRVPNYNTVDEYQALVGKNLWYYYKKNSHGKNPFGLLEVKPVKILSVDFVKSKGKKDKKWSKLKLKIEDVEKGKTATYSYYFGNRTSYLGELLDDELDYGNRLEYEDLTFFFYDKWKEANKDKFDLIGKEVSDKLVKVKYIIEDVVPAYNYKEKNYDVKYEVRNNITGEKRKCYYNEIFNSDKYKTIKEYMGIESPSNAKVGTFKKPDKDAIYSKRFYEYIDDIIDINIRTANTEFVFNIKNVSDGTIKIIWDDAVFVDVDGTTQRIMHKGTKYSERNNSQVPTSIIKGTSIDDIACPVGKVYYDDDWKAHPLYGDKYMEMDYSIYDGKSIRLMLPIQYNGNIYEYLFIVNLKYEYSHPERLNL